jgi:hypothetical protein
MSSKIAPPESELVNPQTVAIHALLEIAARQGGRRNDRLRAIAALLEYAARQRSEAGLVSG